MPWYRVGTVSVTQSSATVVGSGTAFVANSRVGDAFRGPDGSWYEVTNVASDTAMSIAPGYQGATMATGNYALAPMQGYVKDSADALRSMVNTYGAKLAAVGSTANYEVLPLAKGGTGAVTASAARANLGLGTAASANMQANSADVTPGVALTPGAYGWGGTGMVATDANNATITGLHRLNSPYTNGPTAAPYSIVVTRYDNEVAQLAFQEGLATPAVYVRKRTGPATWGSWRGLALNGANTDITSINGLTSALSVAQGGTGVTSVTALLASLASAGGYAKSNAVGVVSQSGGVPTGAIIEQGNNANGSYIKHVDGTLICRGAFQMPAVTINGQIAATAGLPFAMVGTYTVSWTPVSATGTGSQADIGSLLYNGVYFAKYAASISFYIYAYRASQVFPVNCDYIAIGRWY